MLEGATSGEYLHFESNKAGSIFHIKNEEVRGSVQFVNFLGNRGDKTLFQNELYTFQLKKAYFMRDQSLYFTNRFCTFSECFFEITEQEVRAKLQTTAVLTSCTFVVSQNAVMSIPYVVACWTNADGSGGSGGRATLTGAQKFGVVLAIVCLAGVAFVLVKRLCFPDRSDTKMLMYV
jgi:hypothetical protein